MENHQMYGGNDRSAWSRRLVAAQAQQPTPAQSDAIRQSCRSDFMADCAGVQPGGKEALQCLQHNVAKLSPPCKNAVAATMPPPPAAARPPKAPQAAAPPTSPPPHRLQRRLSRRSLR